jgi:hypothetical protein
MRGRQNSAEQIHPEFFSASPRKMRFSADLPSQRLRAFGIVGASMHRGDPSNQAAFSQA